MNTELDYTLYLVTDSDLKSTETLEEAVESAINGGATIVQLREKTATSLAFYNTAKRVKKVTDSYNVPLIINDRVDIAVAIDAHGVHVGQTDLPASVVRKIIGPNKLLGVSASNLTEALAAVENGADYLGVGAMFVTRTKQDATFTSIEELNRICTLLPIPVVAIGGINQETLPLLSGSGIAGVAIVSAILSQPDITAATVALKERWLVGKD